MSASVDIFSSILFAINAFKVLGTGPESGPGHALGAYAKAYKTAADQVSAEGQRAATIAGYQRRQFDWTMQMNLAAKEIEQIDKQILATDIRIAIAEREHQNHKCQMEHAHEVNDFMKSKFTNRELYDWMADSLTSGVHPQVYQLALDAARIAERAYRSELGLPESETRFITAESWDSRRKGLLAGERLYLDLKRMESAYLATNKRELEITKHISLLQLAPGALVLLREAGKCNFTLPEVLFDLDFPNHYLRRIKSVSLSIPCVTGPYASVSAKLELKSNQVRFQADHEKGEQELPKAYMPISSIVTSTGQMDSGMFETNLRDERYLPFEGAGVISEWELSLPIEFKQFDYKTISDVVLHIRYTAREGNDSKPDVAGRLNQLKSPEFNDMTGLIRLFSLRYEFPTEWAKFKDATQPTKMEIKLREQHFPFWTTGKTRAAVKFCWRRNDRTFGELTIPNLNQPEVTIELPELDKTMDDIWLLLMYQLS